MLHLNTQCENVFLFEQLKWICNAGCLKNLYLTCGSMFGRTTGMFANGNISAEQMKILNDFVEQLMSEKEKELKIKLII